ncbi:MAG: hypothetical protein LUH36_02325 [Oscillospiraceae bacterium]|nr:hypothetical protein [Oscillospiraceae bacterium]
MTVDTILAGIRTIGPLVLAVALFAVAWYVTSPKFKGRRAESFFAVHANVGIFFIVVFAIFGLVYIGVHQSEYIEGTAMEITAENTTVPLFLALTPESSMEDVEAMAEEYGWSIGTSEQTGSIKQTSSIKLTVSPDEENTGALFGGRKGVQLELYFDSEGDHPLLSVYLLIKTDSGTASCRYFPTDYTEWGGKTGFNLTVRAKGHLFSEKYLLDTPQEVIDIAYSIVYPLA